MAEKTQAVDVSGMNIKERITRIANELKIGKEGKNTFADYDYIRPDDLDNALKPLYLEYHLFAHFDMERLENEKNLAILKIEDWSTDEGAQVYTMTVDDVSIKGANAAQNNGGLRTYCKRYVLMSAFHISDNKDDLDNNKVPADPPAHKATKSKSEESTAKEILLKLCQEKAKIDRERVLELIKKYSADGSDLVSKVKGLENINNLTEELNNIGEANEDAAQQ